MMDSYLLGYLRKMSLSTEGGDDGLVLVGVLAEDVLDHHHRLLHHVVDLGLDQVKQGGHTPLSTLLHLDCTSTNGSNRFANKVDIDLCCILLQLGEHLSNVGLAGQPDHDVELLQLDVDGVVVLHKEDF